MISSFTTLELYTTHCPYNGSLSICRNDNYLSECNKVCCWRPILNLMKTVDEVPCISECNKDCCWSLMVSWMRQMTVYYAINICVYSGENTSKSGHTPKKEEWLDLHNVCSNHTNFRKLEWHNMEELLEQMCCTKTMFYSRNQKLYSMCLGSGFNCNHTQTDKHRSFKSDNISRSWVWPDLTKCWDSHMISKRSNWHKKWLCWSRNILQGACSRLPQTTFPRHVVVLAP